MNKIKILIVDDHLLVRTGITSLLKDVVDIEIIGEAENGRDAIKKTGELKPDVILMDISMPEISGLEATPKIKLLFPDTKILILTMHENEEYVLSAFKLGAMGILHKNVSKEELITAIKNVYAGKRYFGASISQMVIENMVQKFDESSFIKEKEKMVLTKREKEVLHFVASGLSNQEIADTLEISTRTVDSHKSNLMQKLNVKTSAALAKYAIENNF